MAELKLLSLNVNGMQNPQKRQVVLTWLHNSKADIILLQQTHCSSNCESQWAHEWPGKSYWSNGSTSSRGVAILLKNGLENPIEIS